MRVLIDIGHPGHVHYFRNLYLNLRANGHETLIIARDKDVTLELLDHYQIPFTGRGRGKRSTAGKILYLISASIGILIEGLRFRPQIIISFASPYVSLTSFLLRCPSIILDDTEAGRFERLIYKPFSQMIITPEAFQKDLGIKHFRFDGFMELSYLFPGYFIPDINIKNCLGVAQDEKYTILRFVSWEASHDMGEKGLSMQQKKEIIDLCQKHCKVFISSEQNLPDELEQYRLNIKPHQLHDVLYFARMYIGEGATTASEAAIMGTPAVYINSIYAGTIEEQERSGLLFSFHDFNGVIKQITDILTEPDKMKYLILSQNLVKSKIDLTSFLTWLIGEYPESISIIKENPGYINNFKGIVKY